MKKVILILAALLVLVGCGDNFEIALEKWEERDFEDAEWWLSRVNEDHEHYDSAQMLLVQLPDTAAEYWLALAQRNLEAGEFDQALTACEKSAEFKPDAPGPAELQSKIPKKASAYWVSEAQAFLEEGDFLSTKDACQKALAYTPEDPAALKVQSQLETAEAKYENEQAEIAQKEKGARELEARKQYAKDFEYALLDKGYSVTVTVSGQIATTLKLEWILATKVDAHELTKDPEFFVGLRELGFKKFVLTDGYYESWTWDLD